MTAATLPAEHFNLIKCTAINFAQSHGGDWRDYVTSGWIGLQDAMKTFDPHRGVPFSAYAHRRIKGRIQDDWRVENHTRRSNRPAQRVSLDSTDFVSVRPLNEVDERDAVDALASKLSDTRDRDIVYALADGLSGQELANRTGLKPATVNWRIRNKIRPRLAECRGDE